MITLHHMPGTCSRVTLEALEQTGADYRDRMVSFARDEQMLPEYLALNPRGKVPTLAVEGESLIENAAILYYLARRYPEAGLLPDEGSEVAALRSLSDLIWCSGTLHPLLHRFFKSAAYDAVGDGEGVRSAALAGLHQAAGKIAAQIERGGWWFGGRWSIVDSYLHWIMSGSRRCGFPLDDYPALVEHGGRMERRPAYLRAIAREEAALARDKAGEHWV